MKDNDKKNITQKDASGNNGGKKRNKMSLYTLLFGDFLTADTLRHNAGFIVLVVVCMLLYIGNGYSTQQELIEVNSLKEQVEDARYNALTRSSELLEKSRQSHIEEYLYSKGDSSLQTATTSPYVLIVDTTE